MAGRRCFSGKITESDPFFALTASAQALYLHLNMQADDDGFVNNASSASSRIPGGAAALKKLVEKRFVLKFDDVYVIKHWRISNSLKNDRLKPLAYASIAQKIWVKANKAYTDHPVPGCVTLYEARTGTKPPGEWNLNGIQMESKWNPVGILTEPNLTEPNITEPNITEPNLTEGERVFREIWNTYPQDHTGNAESAYNAFVQVAVSSEDQKGMLESLRLWKQSEQWSKDGGKYIPYLSNWILRGTWQLKPSKLAVPCGASGELGDAELEAIRQVLALPRDQFAD